MTETTAVAKKKDEGIDRLLAIAGDSVELRAQAFALMHASKQAQLIRGAMAGIAGLSWGSKLSPDLRSAVARYALENGTDPVRHWEVLGGRLYDRAELWQDLCASQETYDGHTFEYLHDDDRLSEEDRGARRRLRGKFCVPEGVTAACVVTIHRADKPLPFVGVNWAGEYEVTLAKTGAKGVHRDPIGEENPGKAAYTRAFRKAAKMAYPLWFRRKTQKDPEGGIELGTLSRGEIEERLEYRRQEAKQVESDAPMTHQLAPGVALSAGGKAAYKPVSTEDPYAEEPEAQLTDEEIRQHDVELAQEDGEG